MNKAEKYVTSLFIILMMTLVPLFFHDAFFDMIEAKFTIYSLIFAVFFIPASVILVYELHKSGVFRSSTAVVDISVIVFAAVCLISCLLSGRIHDSFWGNDGWYVGAFSILSAVFIYFFISRCHSYRHNIWIIIYAVNIFIFIVGILNFANIDVFSFRVRLLEKNYFQYISTVGNTNTFSAYLCLLVPMSLVFFVSSESRFSLILNGSFLFFALSNCILIICDSLYIGMGFAVMFVIPYICRTPVRFKRGVFAAWICSLEAFIISVLPCFSDLRAKAVGISGAVLNKYIAASVFVLCSAILLSVQSGVFKKYSGKILRVVFWGLLSVMVLAVIAFLIYTFLTFNDYWGSHRGMIWRVSLEQYSGFSVKDKLLGIGPDILRNYYLEVQKEFKNLPVVSSHSEIVQILLTTGIAGVICWICTWTGVIVSYYKNKTDDVLKTACFTALMAYLAQSFVNSAIIIGIVPLCFTAALYSISLNREKK